MNGLGGNYILVWESYRQINNGIHIIHMKPTININKVSRQLKFFYGKSERHFS